MTRPANHDQFDSHHEYSQKDGYQPAEYEHQEYPKVVGHIVIGQNDKGDDILQEVIAQNADEEQSFLAEQAEENSKTNP